MPMTDASTPRKFSVAPDRPLQRDDRLAVVRPVGRRNPDGAAPATPVDQGLVDDRVGAKLRPVGPDRIVPPVDHRGFSVRIDEDEGADCRIDRHGAGHQGAQAVPVPDIDTAGLQQAGHERRLVTGRQKVIVDLLRDQRNAELRAFAQQGDGVARRTDEGETQHEQQRDGNQRTEAEDQDRRHRQTPSAAGFRARIACFRNRALRIGHEKSPVAPRGLSRNGRCRPRGNAGFWFPDNPPAPRGRLRGRRRIACSRRRASRTGRRRR